MNESRTRQPRSHSGNRRATALGPAACAAAALVLFLAPSALVRAQEPADDPNPYSEIALHVEREGIQPAVPFTAVLQLELDPGWHTYWLNGGDSGLPLVVSWELPEGFSAGPLQWPAPKLQPLPPLMSYGYEDELVLLIEITPTSSLAAGESVTLRVVADWLVCADVCLPAQGVAELSLPVRAEPAPANGPSAALIAAARERLPRSGADVIQRAWSADGGYVIEVLPPAGAELVAPYFFADDMLVAEHATRQRALTVGGAVRIWIKRSEFADQPAETLSGLLVADVRSAGSVAFTVSVPVLPIPEPVPARENPFASAAAVETGGFALAGVGAPVGPGAGLAVVLLLAFAGGVLLNLMPCVFPVLSLKVLSFAGRAGRDRSGVRRHGLAFGAGVLVSFWVLAAALIALRAGGQSLGWGFQLQSPAVVAGLALVMFALGLSLSGVLELGLGLTRLGGAASGDGYCDSFATGALAVVVATPCTAPFMGSALGYALVQPAAVGMSVFTALALGLAAPYVLLSFRPQLLERLPRPGRWMETLKQVLAFPLYATAVWLVWVFGRQAGMDAAAVLLLALTAVGFAAWLWGRSTAGPQRLARGAAVLIAGAALVASVQAARPGGAGAGAAVEWEEYSPERVSALVAEGRPVLVDFTAAWCLSCQVNERVALRSTSAQRAFDEANVALLKADWTSRDPVIAEVLESFGRSGVPLYVLYPALGRGTPELLPTLLTPRIVVDAVSRAVQAGREAGAG